MMVYTICMYVVSTYEHLFFHMVPSLEKIVK